MGIYLGTQHIDILQPEFKPVVELCFLVHEYIHDSDVHVKYNSPLVSQHVFLVIGYLAIGKKVINVFIST